MLPVGEYQRPWSHKELIPPRDRGLTLWKDQRKQREERLHWLSHVGPKTHMQVEPLLPKVNKAATQTSLVLADGTHEKRNVFFLSFFF